MENTNYTHQQIITCLKKLSIYLNKVLENFASSKYMYKGWDNVSTLWLTNEIRKLTEDLDENINLISEMFLIPNIDDNEIKENINKSLETIYITANFLFMLSDNLIQIKEKYDLCDLEENFSEGFEESFIKIVDKQNFATNNFTNLNTNEQSVPFEDINDEGFFDSHNKNIMNDTDEYED